jgi:uracil phosphoribosyltransferase
VAAASGLARFHGAHPGVPVVCGAIDPGLDDRGFIVPGLGDAGDRLFGPP